MNTIEELPGIHLTSILSMVEGMEVAMVRLGETASAARNESIQMLKMGIELLENS